MNPYIELEGTPFCVVRERREWNEPSGAPWRAEPLEITERWLRGETVDWSEVTPRYRTVFLPGYRFRRSIMALEAPPEVTADGALTDLDAISPP